MRVGGGESVFNYGSQEILTKKGNDDQCAVITYSSNSPQPWGNHEQNRKFSSNIISPTFSALSMFLVSWVLPVRGEIEWCGRDPRNWTVVQEPDCHVPPKILWQVFLRLSHDGSRHGGDCESRNVLGISRTMQSREEWRRSEWVGLRRFLSQDRRGRTCECAQRGWRRPCCSSWRRRRRSRRRGIARRARTGG